MIQIAFADEDIENLINHKYTGKYKKYKSSSKLISDLDKVMRRILSVDNVNELYSQHALNFEKLDNNPYYSVRVGYFTKYRLLFTVEENKIKICIIELSEHYGDT